MIPLVKFLLMHKAPPLQSCLIFLSFHAKIIFSTDSKIHWNRAWAYKSISKPVALKWITTVQHKRKILSFHFFIVGKGLRTLIRGLSGNSGPRQGQTHHSCAPEQPYSQSLVFHLHINVCHKYVWKASNSNCWWKWVTRKGGHSEPAPTSAPWRMNDKWSGNSFLLSSSSLANHGG
jgi:hypothetical protein